MAKAGNVDLFNFLRLLIYFIDLVVDNLLSCFTEAVYLIPYLISIAMKN